MVLQRALHVGNIGYSFTCFFFLSFIRRIHQTWFGNLGSSYTGRNTKVARAAQLRIIGNCIIVLFLYTKRIHSLTCTSSQLIFTLRPQPLQLSGERELFPPSSWRWNRSFFSCAILPLHFIPSPLAGSAVMELVFFSRTLPWTMRLLLRCAPFFFYMGIHYSLLWRFWDPITLGFFTGTTFLLSYQWTWDTAGCFFNFKVPSPLDGIYYFCNDRLLW